MVIVDKKRFEERSRAGCKESDYDLRKTCCCSEFGIFDDELNELYVDSADLKKVVSYGFEDSPPQCPFCKAENWEIKEVESVAEVPDKWRWACVESS